KQAVNAFHPLFQIHEKAAQYNASGTPFSSACWVTPVQSKRLFTLVTASLQRWQASLSWTGTDTNRQRCPLGAKNLYSRCSPLARNGSARRTRPCPLGRPPNYSGLPRSGYLPPN